MLLMTTLAPTVTMKIAKTKAMTTAKAINDSNVSVNDSYHDDSENESDNDNVRSRSMSVSEQLRTYPSP